MHAGGQRGQNIRKKRKTNNNNNKSELPKFRKTRTFKKHRAKRGKIVNPLSRKAQRFVFSDDDSDADMADLEVADMTAEQLYSPLMGFDRPHEDNFRARVADEYSRLLSEAQRAGRNIKSTRVIDELDYLANKNITDLDNNASASSSGGARPLRQAARQAKGAGGSFYSELHYYGEKK